MHVSKIIDFFIFHFLIMIEINSSEIFSLMDDDKRYHIIRETLEGHGFDFIQQIGHGGFATAYLITSRQYNQKFVAKVFDISQTDDERNTTSFESEISALVQLIHPNIISIFDHFTTENFLYLILEYCPNGTLNDMIKEYSSPIVPQNPEDDQEKSVQSSGNCPNRGIPPPLLYNLALQILIALNFCQNRGIAHRDIKPSNIFIDKYGRPKLADFGFATNFFKRELADTYAGSLPFMPLEILHLTPYDPVKADIWSLGVTFFIMATGYLPFKPKSPNNLAMLIATREVQIPDYVEPEFADIIRSMLKVNPSQRSSITSILLTPFFRRIESNFKNERKINRSYNRSNIRNSMSFSDIKFSLPSSKSPRDTFLNSIETNASKIELKPSTQKIASLGPVTPRIRLASSKAVILNAPPRNRKQNCSSFQTFSILPTEF